MAAPGFGLEKTAQGEMAAREVERMEIYTNSWAWKNPLPTRYRVVVLAVEGDDIEKI